MSLNRTQIPRKHLGEKHTAVAVALMFLAVSASAVSAGVGDCRSAVSSQGTLMRDCRGEVVVSNGKLDLAGHTINGGIVCASDHCEVSSDPPNGRVLGFGDPNSFGIRSTAPVGEHGGSIALKDVIVSGFGTGVLAGSVYVEDSLVAGNAKGGIDAVDLVEMERSIASLNTGFGVRARTGSVSIHGGTVSENEFSGIYALTGVIVTDSLIHDNARDGIENYSGECLVLRTKVTHNGRHGVRSGDSDCYPSDLVEVTESEVTGNGWANYCSVGGVCADLVACDRPQVDSRNSCGTTYQMMSGRPGSNWSICRND
jgi:hypothetical protein